MFAYRLAIDEAPIGATEVAKPVGISLFVEPGMLARDFRIVQLDVVRRNATHGDVIVAQIVARSLVAALDDEQTGHGNGCGARRGRG